MKNKKRNQKSKGTVTTVLKTIFMHKETLIFIINLFLGIYNLELPNHNSEVSSRMIEIENTRLIYNETSAHKNITIEKFHYKIKF